MNIPEEGQRTCFRVREESEEESWNMLCCICRQMAHHSSVTPLQQLCVKWGILFDLGQFCEGICFQLAFVSTLNRVMKMIKIVWQLGRLGLTGAHVPVAPLIATSNPVASFGPRGSGKSEAGNLGHKLYSLLVYVSVIPSCAKSSLSFISLFTAGLGDHEPSGLCCARVSEDGRVGRNMGKRCLPCVQLFPKVRSTFLHASLFIHTSAL